MNRKRRIYLILCGLSVFAFIVDRVFLSEPDLAAANNLAVQSPSASSANQAASPTSPGIQSADDGSLTWLEELPSTEEIRDVFAMSNGFLGQPHLQLGSETSHEIFGADPLDTFAAEHVLYSTMVGKPISLAIVDEKVLRTGSKLDGFQLIKVERSRAVFRHEASGKNVALSLVGLKP